jgi:hypothetical protein
LLGSESSDSSGESQDEIQPNEQRSRFKDENAGGESSTDNTDLGTQARDPGGDQQNPEGEEDFDWNRDDDTFEDHAYKKKMDRKDQPLTFFLYGKYGKWFKRFIIVFIGLALIAVTAVLNVLYAGRQNDVSQNLELWFTFLTFIYVVAIVTHYFVEIIPGVIKRFVKRMTPTNLEIFKMRLAVRFKPVTDHLCTMVTTNSTNLFIKMSTVLSFSQMLYQNSLGVGLGMGCMGVSIGST